MWFDILRIEPINYFIILIHREFLAVFKFEHLFLPTPSIIYSSLAPLTTGSLRSLRSKVEDRITDELLASAFHFKWQAYSLKGRPRYVLIFVEANKPHKILLLPLNLNLNLFFIWHTFAPLLVRLPTLVIWLGDSKPFETPKSRRSYSFIHHLSLYISSTYSNSLSSWLVLLAYWRSQDKICTDSSRHLTTLRGDAQ